jgi:hypothetical protein
MSLVRFHQAISGSLHVILLFSFYDGSIPAAFRVTLISSELPSDVTKTVLNLHYKLPMQRRCFAYEIHI